MNTVSRIENLRYILRTLLAEREEYAGWRIPDVLETQQTMMRALLNVRPPQPVSPEFLQAQDAELRQQLAECYRSCLALADAHGLASIAFCCISTGEFGFPQERAAQIAVGTVTDCLKTASYIQTVVFNVFKDEDLSIYRGLLP